MSQSPPDPILLNASRAAFLVGPVAINVASRSPERIPSIARAFGCRVSADRRELVVFVSVSRARALARDLGGGAPVAAIFSRPRTHESLQVKGDRAQLQSVTPAELEMMRDYGSAFAAEIQSLGYSAAFARTLVAPALDDDALAVRFRVSAVFEQTPGPHAGERLGPKA